MFAGQKGFPKWDPDLGFTRIIKHGLAGFDELSFFVGGVAEMEVGVILLREFRGSRKDPPTNLRVLQRASGEVSSGDRGHQDVIDVLAVDVILGDLGLSFELDFHIMPGRPILLDLKGSLSNLLLAAARTQRHGVGPERGEGFEI